MDYLAGRATELGRLVAAQLGGSVKRRTPWHIRLHIAPRGEILIERDEGVMQGLGAYLPPERRETDPVHQFGARMRRNRDRTAGSRAPGIHRAGFRLVQ